jgi:hypothetical protein
MEYRHKRSATAFRFLFGIVDIRVFSSLFFSSKLWYIIGLILSRVSAALWISFLGTATNVTPSELFLNSLRLNPLMVER